MGDTINYPRRSNSATTANFAIIVLVGYLVLTYLKPILMPFCIAILFYFLIRAPEQYLVARFEIVARMPMLAYGVMIGIGAAISYGISILLYRNIDQFQGEMTKQGGLTDKFREKWDALGEANLYGLEEVITSQETIENLVNPKVIQDFAT
ncbi:MAG TPA: hypothetical protein D7H77_01165, partial [Candidatus Poseidoniales archaeon]